MEVHSPQADTELGRILREASFAASTAMAHTLAHHINNPLQSITNSIFLAQHSQDPAARSEHLEQASNDLRLLSRLVGDLLMLHQSAAPNPDAKPLQ